MKTFIPLSLFFLSLLSFAQTPISDIRDDLSAGGGIGAEYTITGVALNGPELGIIRYVSDETGYMAVYGNAVGSSTTGDIITVKGTLAEFNGLIEIDVNAPGGEVSIVSSGNPLPDPVVLGLGDVSETYEANLVRFNGVNFVDSGSFGGDANYDIEDGNGNILTVRIDEDTDIVGSTIPDGAIDLIGLIGEFNGYQLLPRSLNDFDFGGAPGITAVRPQNFDQTSITVEFGTQGMGNTVVTYSTSPDMSNPQTITDDAMTTEHEVVLNDLEPGDIYFVQVSSTGASGEASTSGIIPFGTVSASTGKIDVYFNTPVDNSVSSGVDAVYLNETMADTIIKYLDNAEISVDMMVYSFDNNLGIVSALNDAYDRGVAVRFISDEDQEGGTLSYEQIDIGDGNKILRPDFLQGIMHNKIIIIDAESDDPNKPVVVTGATNFSFGQLQEDSNDLIFIQDQTLAKAYTLEMDEMMSGVFSVDKTDNTPHQFLIGGSEVELYFSPTDGIEAIMEEVIATADDELYFAILSFTRRNIAFAIEEAIDDGVCVAGIMDVFYESDQLDPVEVLEDEMGIGVLLHESPAGIFHHKYMVVDPNSPDSDPTVITGSTNWSGNGFSRSDENMLIIHNESIANQYWQSFSNRFQHYAGFEVDCNLTSIENVEINNAIRIYPNPVNEKLFFNIDAKDSEEVSLQLFDLNGQELLNRSFPVQVGNTLYYANLPDLASGMYIVNINGKTSRLIVK